MVVIVLKLKKIKITRAFFFFFWKNKNWLKNCFYLRYFNHFFIIIFCHLQRVWCSLQEQVASSFWNKTLINYILLEKFNWKERRTGSNLLFICPPWPISSFLPLVFPILVRGLLPCFFLVAYVMGIENNKWVNK
jgi:hypothetical protein